MALLEFIFRDGWTFIGFFILLWLVCTALSSFKVVDNSTNYYYGDNNE